MKRASALREVIASWRGFERRITDASELAGLDDDDLEQDDLQLDITEEVSDAGRARFKGEAAYIEAGSAPSTIATGIRSPRSAILRQWSAPTLWRCQCIANSRGPCTMIR